MVPRYSRRFFLSVAGTLSLAGCETTDPRESSSPTTSETATPSSPETGPRGPVDAVLATEQVSLSPPPSHPIRVADLPAEERDVVIEAIQSGAYHRCDHDTADQLQSFRERVYSLRPHEPYLRYNNAYYGVWLRFLDQVYATTASSPAESELKDCRQ